MTPTPAADTAPGAAEDTTTRPRRWEEYFFIFSFEPDIICPWFHVPLLCVSNLLYLFHSAYEGQENICFIDWSFGSPSNNYTLSLCVFRPVAGIIIFFSSFFSNVTFLPETWLLGRVGPIGRDLSTTDHLIVLYWIDYEWRTLEPSVSLSWAGHSSQNTKYFQFFWSRIINIGSLNCSWINTFICP